MNDQALKLREIARSYSTSSTQKAKKKKRAKSVAVTSGKGGVGKSNIALNLAITLSKAGFKTLLLDADLNLANLNILMGMTPRYNLSSMFLEKLPVEKIIHEGPEGLHIISGCSGERDLVGIEQILKDFVIDSLIEIEKEYDYIVVDTAAGIDSFVTDFLLGADEVMLIVTPEPTSILDAYALIKVLTTKGIYGNISVVINLASSFDDAKDVYKKLGMAVKKFLSYKIKYAGYLPKGKEVVEAVRTQIPFVISKPNSKITKELKEISLNIAKSGDKKYIENNIDSSYFNKIKSLLIKRRVN